MRASQRAEGLEGEERGDGPEPNAIQTRPTLSRGTGSEEIRRESGTARAARARVRVPGQRAVPRRAVLRPSVCVSGTTTAEVCFLLRTSECPGNRFLGLGFPEDVKKENMSRIFTTLFVAFVMAQLFSNNIVLHVRNRARHGKEVLWTTTRATWSARRARESPGRDKQPFFSFFFIVILVSQSMKTHSFSRLTFHAARRGPARTAPSPDRERYVGGPRTVCVALERAWLFVARGGGSVQSKCFTF